jgi:FXSXX-COOH protein
MGVEDADLISDLLDLRGEGLRRLDGVPQDALLAALRRLVEESEGSALAFYGFQNMMVDRTMEPPAPS